MVLPLRSNPAHEAFFTSPTPCTKFADELHFEHEYAVWGNGICQDITARCTRSLSTGYCHFHSILRIIQWQLSSGQVLWENQYQNHWLLALTTMTLRASSVPLLTIRASIV